MVSPNVVDTSDATFEQDVIAASAEQPVVVDFWAPWCGPCRILGPILEQMADAYAGQVRVVKLNTDENPQTASRFGISGIPAVIAFRDGRPVNQFVGAQPEPQVRSFFEALQPSESDLQVVEALRLVQAGQEGAARLHLEEALEKNPDHKDAGLALAALLADSGETERAIELAQRWPNEPGAKHILGALAFAQHSDGLDQAALESRLAANDDDADAHYRLGCLLAAQGDWQTALEHLLRAVKLDRTLDDDGPRLRMIDAFGVLGDDHPLTREYRRQLSRALF